MQHYCRKTAFYSTLSGDLFPAILTTKRRTQLRAPASPACSTQIPDDGNALQCSACTAVYKLMDLAHDIAVFQGTMILFINNPSKLTAALIMLSQCSANSGLQNLLLLLDSCEVRSTSIP